MSYDCSLIDPVTKERIKLGEKHFIKGGTYALGGTDELWLNITFNYSSIIYDVLEGGIPGLHGKFAAETIAPLKAAVEKLGDDVDEDYWKATEGNVKRALTNLLALAYMRPNGEWEICY